MTLALVGWLILCVLIVGLDLRRGRRIRVVTGDTASATDDLAKLATVACVGGSLIVPLLWPGPEAPWSFVISGCGALTVTAGLWIRREAMIDLGDSYTLTPMMRGEEQIVTNGIYHHIRHPGYLGLVLQLSGLGLVLGQPLACVGILWLIPCVVVRISVEERLLESTSAYRAYVRVTPYRLVPRVW